jgi:hypothetical protein
MIGARREWRGNSTDELDLAVDCPIKEVKARPAPDFLSRRFVSCDVCGLQRSGFL